MARKLVEVDRPVRRVEARRGAEWSRERGPIASPPLPRCSAGGSMWRRRRSWSARTDRENRRFWRGSRRPTASTPKEAPRGPGSRRGVPNHPCPMRSSSCAGRGPRAEATSCAPRRCTGCSATWSPRGPDPFHALSHGESFRAILESRTRTLRGDLRPGLYVLDEPESALSFTSALHALAALVEMTRASSHSGADRHPLPRLCRIARGRTVAVGHRRLACHHLGGSRPGGQRAVLPG
jgi:hypothetical protein